MKFETGKGKKPVNKWTAGMAGEGTGLGGMGRGRTGGEGAGMMGRSGVPLGFNPTEGRLPRGGVPIRGGGFAKGGAPEVGSIKYKERTPLGQRQMAALRDWDAIKGRLARDPKKLDAARRQIESAHGVKLPQ